MADITVRDIYNAINRVADFNRHDKYDNVGILVGKPEDKVTRVLIALDITRKVALEAIDGGYDLIVTHHPLIFNPLYTLSDDTVSGMLLKNGIAHIAAHTNLDMARGGVSDIMAELLGLENTEKVFEVKEKNPYYQVTVFVPQTHTETVYDAMQRAGAGKQGNYSGCAYKVSGEGRFMPLESSNAFIGNIGELEKVCEDRIEMLVKPSALSSVISAMRNAHPYEEPAFTVCENHALYEEEGYGKVCTCKETTAKELAALIKERYGNTVVRYTDSGKKIRTVAVCSGAGSSNTALAIALGIDAYITGDVKYSDFVDAERAGLTLIDAGHFHTENIVLPYLHSLIAPLVTADIAKNGEPISYIV